MTSVVSSIQTLLAPIRYSLLDPEIFQRALRRLHADPARSVFVGDHPGIDIAGARAVGLQTVWRRDPTVSRVVEADATIEEVGDLLSLLA